MEEMSLLSGSIPYEPAVRAHLSRICPGQRPSNSYAPHVREHANSSPGFCDSDSKITHLPGGRRQVRRVGGKTGETRCQRAFQGGPVFLRSAFPGPRFSIQ
jgi:hypothetical protein